MPTPPQETTRTPEEDARRQLEDTQRVANLAQEVGNLRIYADATGDPADRVAYDAARTRLQEQSAQVAQQSEATFVDPNIPGARRRSLSPAFAGRIDRPRPGITLIRNIYIH